MTLARQTVAPSRSMQTPRELSASSVLCIVRGPFDRAERHERGEEEGPFVEERVTGRMVGQDVVRGCGCGVVSVYRGADAMDATYNKNRVRRVQNRVDDVQSVASQPRTIRRLKTLQDSHSDSGGWQDEPWPPPTSFIRRPLVRTPAGSHHLVAGHQPQQGLTTASASRATAEDERCPAARM
ncbi:hypothetical protein FOMPIDRAFT_1056712 [Fomitopsis schrenkii]|uniref:Uncharacterized protein n=1 Tax=Fomitopsis schrenkii TaxID=2126942 RepID=S8DMN4_FOMSC|nr:hypothetical protein FOMPIDRAFT_1056712 [Fomitopsis schrenkii]